MELIQSIIMGIVQGLSEFLPISSSGHLVFSSNIYKVLNGIEITQASSQEVFFDIMLHLGTLIAVLVYFRAEIYSIIHALFEGIKTKNYKEKDFLWGVYIILGTIVTAIIAYPLSNIAKKLVYSPALVGVLLIFTGILLLLSEYISKKYSLKKEVSIKKSIIIGIAQGLASLPGFSRSGLTISAGLLGGMERNEAARYSFLLSIPIILGASMVYPLLEIDFAEVLSYNWTAILIGTVVSGFVGYLCIKYFLKFVAKFSLSIFGYYCLLAGIISALYFSS